MNTLKIGVKSFLENSPFVLKPVPWTTDGFYYDESDHPGKHPYYHAGLYYIQEPSAMLPGAVMDAKPGERILDLCAAPGGKSVQMAAGMCGQGLLVANDTNSGRIRSLVKNLELCGVRNAIVTHESPEHLCSRFDQYFDGILVDAPCSGEGMFRKDDDAVCNWNRYNDHICSGIQQEILENAHRMLHPGGRLVYSTCTFAPEEDEMVIARFMDKHPEYSLQETPRVAGIENGRPEWADGRQDLVHTARLWPHKLDGEGHFTALLQKKGERRSIHIGIPETGSGWLSNFASLPDVLASDIQGHYTLVGNSLYCLPVPYPDLRNITVIKFGWYMGDVQNGVLTPSHSLVLSLHRDNLVRSVDFSWNSREMQSYLKGETILADGPKGLTGICVDTFTAGWAKQADGILKNLYPKGWRRMK